MDFKRVLKEAWRLLYPILLYFLASLFVELAFLFVYAGDGGQAKITEQVLNEVINKYSLHITALANGILIPFFLLFMWNDKRHGLSFGGLRYATVPPAEYLKIVALGMASAIVVNLAVSLSGLVYLSPKYQEVSNILYSGSIFIEILSAVIAAPVLEEIMFRGLIFGRLRVYLAPKAAMVISSLIFGLFHGNLVQFAYAFIIGMLLAYVYEKYKKITAPIMFHIGANLLSVIVTEFVGEKITPYAVMAAALVSLVAMCGLLKIISKYKAEVL